ncbi:MAG: hypothetical protein KAI53_01680 [Candidatus Aenigmarchaeota archaeon]|nr:hypothetical protein [Candidatus Aenigmarchaeota archaeon]
MDKITLVFILLMLVTTVLIYFSYYECRYIQTLYGVMARKRNAKKHDSQPNVYGKKEKPEQEKKKNI